MKETLTADMFIDVDKNPFQIIRLLTAASEHVVIFPSTV